MCWEGTEAQEGTKIPETEDEFPGLPWESEEGSAIPYQVQTSSQPRVIMYSGTLSHACHQSEHFFFSYSLVRNSWLCVLHNSFISSTGMDNKDVTAHFW